MSGHSVIDYDRSACLCDAGAPGYAAAVCITDSGDDVLVLVSTEALDSGNPGNGNPDQPHEQLGPLPDVIRDRIASSGQPIAYWRSDGHGYMVPVYLCGRPNRKKRPCGIAVARAGDACQFHGPKPPEPRCWGCDQPMEKQGTVWGCFGCDPDGYWTQADWMVTT